MWCCRNNMVTAVPSAGTGRQRLPGRAYTWVLPVDCCHTTAASGSSRGSGGSTTLWTQACNNLCMRNEPIPACEPPFASATGGMPATCARPRPSPPAHPPACTTFQQPTAMVSHCLSRLSTHAQPCHFADLFIVEVGYALDKPGITVHCTRWKSYHRAAQKEHRT